MPAPGVTAVKAWWDNATGASYQAQDPTPPRAGRSPGAVFERGNRVGVVGKLVGLVPGLGRAGIGFNDRRVRNDIDAEHQLVACVLPWRQNRLRRGIRDCLAVVQVDARVLQMPA